MSGATYLKLTQKTQALLESIPPFNKDDEIDLAQIQKIKKELTGVDMPDVDIETKLHPFDNNNFVKVTVYRPLHTKDQPLPALIYVHGGGWVLERTDNYPFMCAKIAKEAHCVVIYVHYSTSPKVRFPYALEQCYTVADVYTSPNNEGVDPSRIVIGGDSSGGNLAIGVTLLAKERQLKNPLKYQVLFYPVTNDQFNTASYFEFGTNVNLTRKAMQFFWDQYVPDKEQRKQKLASPLRATTSELENLPPALMIVAEADVIRDEAEDYARALLQAKVPVYCSRVLGVVHGFITDPDLFCDDTLLSLDMAVASLKRVFSKQ